MNYSDIISASVDYYFARSDYKKIVEKCSSWLNYLSDAQSLHKLAFSAALYSDAPCLKNVLVTIAENQQFNRITSLLLASILPQPWKSFYFDLSVALPSNTSLHPLEAFVLTLPDLSSKFSLDYSFYFNPSHTLPSWPLAKSTTQADALVISWDGQSNALGRAYVLAETLSTAGYHPSILAPLNSNCKLGIWSPILGVNSNFLIDTFLYTDVSTFFKNALEYVRNNYYPMVWISKYHPRSILAGWLYKIVHNSKVVVDVDDYESAFIGETRDFLSVSNILGSPFYDCFACRTTNFSGRSWYELAHWLGQSFHYASAPNRILLNSIKHQRTLLVPHLRHPLHQKLISDPLPSILHSSYKVIFNGTIRPHKQLDLLISCLSRLADKSRPIELYVYNQKATNWIPSISSAYFKIHILQACNLASNLDNVAKADLLCCLQDPQSLISYYQSPAKVSDAFICDTPVLAYRTPPLEELSSMGARIFFVDDYIDFETSFLTALSHKGKHTNSKQITFNYHKSSIKNFLKSIEVQGITTQDTYVVTWLQQIYNIYLHEFKGESHSPISPQPAIPLDIVMVWRQHDTGVYPRRHHSLALRFIEDSRVKRVVHFEPPISIQNLHKLSNTDSKILERCTNRYNNRYDRPKISYPLFIYDNANNNKYPPESSFHSYYRHILHVNHVSDNHILWLYPPYSNLNFLLPLVKDRFIVADFVDNIMVEHMDDNTRNYLNSQYLYFANSSDLCIVNCPSMAEIVHSYGATNVLLVENAYPGRNFSKLPSYKVNCESLSFIYTGNMNGRIDWRYVIELACTHPDYKFYFYGDIRDDYIPPLQNIDNVYLRQPVSAELLPSLFSDGAIAFIPHAFNEKNQYMNLIKLYEYRSLGIPVIARALIPPESLDHIYTANTITDFELAVNDILNYNLTHDCFQPHSDFYRSHNWDARANFILNHIENIITRKD